MDRSAVDITPQSISAPREMPKLFLDPFNKPGKSDLAQVPGGGKAALIFQAIFGPQ